MNALSTFMTAMLKVSLANSIWHDGGESKAGAPMAHPLPHSLLHSLLGRY
jgi:hypothetical protein